MDEQQYLQRIEELEAENSLLREELDRASANVSALKEQLLNLETGDEYSDMRGRIDMDIQQMEEMLRKAYLTVSEVCILLGQSRQSIHRHIALGSLEGVDVSTPMGTKPNWRIKSDSVRRLLKLDEVPAQRKLDTASTVQEVT